MRHSSVALTAALLIAVALSGQTTDVSLHVNVKLVQIDAVVTDKKDKAVTKLTATDFEVLQDGKPQHITNFSYVNAVPAKPSSSLVAGSPAPPPVNLQAADIRRTFAIVVDDLGLARENIQAVKNSLRTFVQQSIQPSDLTAILATGGGMGALQHLTSDQRQLLAAIDGLKFNISSRVSDNSFAAVGSSDHLPGALKFRVSREQTFHVLQEVLQSLRDLPGRKMLLFVSENLPGVTDGFVRKIVDEANRASVVIYALDARSLPPLQLTAEDDVRTKVNYPDDTKTMARQVAIQRHNLYLNTESGMEYIATETGGRFFHNTNDLAGALSAISADSAGYYLIGYQPSEKTFAQTAQEPVFHKLEVRLRRPGLHVRSRSGFFNVPDNAEDAARARLHPTTKQGQIDSAFASPFSSAAIHANLSAFFIETQQEGAVIESWLHFDTRDLRFSEAPNGTHHAEVEVVWMLDHLNGEKPEFQAQTVALNLAAEAYQVALKSGFTTARFVRAASPGPYQIKVVLRDNEAQTVGSASQFLEVPDARNAGIALSGVIVRGTREREMPTTVAVKDSDPGLSPALRSLPRGGKLFFGYQILRPHLNDKKQPELLLQTRLFHEGKQIYSGQPTPFDPHQAATGAIWDVDREISLDPRLEPGQYVLQVTVTDQLAPAKNRTAEQSADFEIRP